MQTSASALYEMTMEADTETVIQKIGIICGPTQFSSAAERLQQFKARHGLHTHYGGQGLSLLSGKAPMTLPLDMKPWNNF